MLNCCDDNLFIRSSSINTQVTNKVKFTGQNDTLSTFMSKLKRDHHCFSVYILFWCQFCEEVCHQFFFSHVKSMPWHNQVLEILLCILGFREAQSLRGARPAAISPGPQSDMATVEKQRKLDPGCEWLHWKSQCIYILLYALCLKYCSYENIRFP